MKSAVLALLVLTALAAQPLQAEAQSTETTPATAGNAPSNHLGPQIQFNTESYDFAKFNALSGELIKFTFVATNTGDEPLDIYAVRPSCSCTTVEGGWNPVQLAPHATSLIPIQINPSGLRGLTEKSVAVISNDRSRPQVTLVLHGNLWRPLEYNPTLATFNFKPDATSNASTVVQIVNQSSEPLVLSPPESSTNTFSAVLRTNRPGQQFDLVVTALAPTQLSFSRETTIVQGVITMHTSDSNLPLLSIPAMVFVQPEVVVSPNQINLPGGPLPTAMPISCIIRGNTSRPLILSEPTLNIPGVALELKVLETNQTYRLALTLPQGFEIKRGEYFTATVKSDNPHYTTITVPIVQVPSEALPATAH